MALKGMPAPVPDLDTQPFWDALGNDRLLLPHCASCDKPRWPPGPMCPYCSSLEMDWRDAPATATLYSWEVIHHPAHPSLLDQVPYVIAIAQFADKVRLVGNIVNWDGRSLRDGIDLKVTFETRDDGVRIYNFLM
jgi:uncharacterized OB-fold protein